MRRFEAVHLRHLNVHEDDVVVTLGNGVDRFPSVPHDVHLVAALDEHGHGDLLVDGVVFRQQHAHRTTRFRNGMARDDLGRRLFRSGEHGAQRFEEIRARDRFRQIPADAQLAAALAVAALARRCQHQQPGAGQRLVGANSCGELEAVHVRHLHIQNCQIVRRSLRDGAAQRGQSIRGSGHFVDLDGFGGQHTVKNAPIGLIVIDDEHAPTGQRGNRSNPAGRSYFGGQRNRKGELAAASHFTRDLELASHELHHALRDGETQAGSTVAARHGRVRLRELLEDRLPMFRRNADSRVADGKAQSHVIVRDRHRRDGDHNFALLGELDRVADQIHEHLAESRRIAADRAWHDGRDLGEQLEMLFARAYGEQARGGVDHLRDIKGD